MRDEPLRIIIDGTTHVLTNEFESITACGEPGPMDVDDFQSALTLDPVDCLMCLSWPGFLEYRCPRCGWVGNDPFVWKGHTWCHRCNVLVAPVS